MKALKYILTFILLIVFFYMSVLFILSKVNISGRSAIFQANTYFHWKGGDTYYKFHDFKKDSVYDFIFLGSSRAYRGYNPYLFEKEGYSSWNLGSNAQSIENSLEVIKEYVTAGNCKHLLLDIYPSAMMIDGFESSIDLIENTSSINIAYNVATNHYDFRLVNAFVYRLFSDGQNPVFKNEDYLGKGFCMRTDSLNEKAIKVLNSYKAIKNKPVKELDEEHLNKLDELINYCKQNSIDLILVFSPTSDAYADESYKHHIALIKSLLSKNEVTFLDYAKKLNINSYTEFYDDSHMNERGVEKYNNILIRDLKSMFND